MSSAIEVLKEWLDKPIIFNEIFMTKEEYIEQVNLKVATKEALLALEALEHNNFDELREKIKSGRL